MLPVDFEFRNLVLGKPQNMTDEECMPLPVHRTPGGQFISKWKLNKEELELIQQTGEIYFQVYSVAHPPICPMVENPFQGEYVKPGDRVSGQVPVAGSSQLFQVEGVVEDSEGLLVLNTGVSKLAFYMLQNVEWLSRAGE